jgi:hypothetical protein
MIGYARDARRAGRGPGAFTIGAVAAAAVAISSAAWPIGGSLAATRPVSGGAPVAAKTPIQRTSWVPVPFRRAQLSVPGGWFVEGPAGFFCEKKSDSMIFVGTTPRVPKGQSPGCRQLHPSYAWIVPIRHLPPGIYHRKPTLINGIHVYRERSVPTAVVYLVPELGVRVGAHGPKAKRILATLNRSPLDTVLAAGPARPAPASWVRREFGGVKFAAPRGWHRFRDNVWEACGTGVAPHAVDLINAKKPPIPIPCPFPLPIAKDIAARPGLVVVTGKFAARSVAETYRRCLVRAGTRICLSTQTGVGGLFGGVLIFSVAKPHHHRASTYVLLGLPGPGSQARAIFDSISVR